MSFKIERTIKHPSLSFGATLAGVAMTGSLWLLSSWATTAGEAIALQGQGAPACATCHGSHGEGGGNGMYPRLSGLSAAYIENQLKAFRDAKRVNPLMTPMVSGLADADIAAVAQYFSQQQSGFAPATPVTPLQHDRGQTLVTIGAWEQGIAPCAGCHGPQLQGVAPAIPALAGQWQRYLAAQLDAYQKGGRSNPLGLMTHVTRSMSAEDIESVAAYIANLRPGVTPEPPRPAVPEPWAAVPQSADTFRPPPDGAIPSGTFGDLVRMGQSIFEDTPKNAANYSGNALSCRNCHLDRGRAIQSSPMWAAYVHYPEYRKKDGLVNTLQMRIQGCFRYSQNGVAPPADSREVTALVTYFYWLATGLPVGIKPKVVGYPKLGAPRQPPSPDRGAKIYSANCALCHGDDGQGRSTGGYTVFPPLWGPQSFNWGAGMHQVDVSAAFIRSNMPYGAGDRLTEQEAWDVAAYVGSRPRPQDPRFTNSVDETRERFHAGHAYDYFGQEVDGMFLGAPAPADER